MSAGRAPVSREAPPPPGPLRPFHFPEVHRRTLPNGVEVLVAEAHQFPVVSLGLLVRAGGVHEEPARAGTALLTGDLLDSGAGGRTGVEIAEELEGLGVLHDSSVSWESAYVGFTALRSRIEPASGVLADLVLHPDFPPGEVDRLRGERLAAIAQRRASPGGLAGEAAARVLYTSDSPFSRPLGGTPETVQGITRADVEGYHATRYTPAGAAVVVTGDIGPDEAAELAERHLGDWIGAPPPAPAPEARPRPAEPGIVLVDRPGSVQSEIRVGHVGISRTDPDYLPVTVMNHILGGGFASRLNLSLRERHGYTYGVRSSFTARRAPGPFLVSTAVQSEVTAAAIREILHEIRGMRERPPATAELEDARSYLAGVFPLSLETTTGIASRLVSLVLYGLPADYWDRYRDRILEVTGEDVLRVAREHLRPDDLRVVVVGDAAELRPSLEELGVGEVRTFDPTVPGA